MLDAEVSEQEINIKRAILPETARSSRRPFDAERDVSGENWEQILSYADELKFLIENTSATNQPDRFNDLVRKLSSLMCSLEIVSPNRSASMPRNQSLLLNIVTAAANTKVAEGKRLQLLSNAATLFPEKRESIIIPPEFIREGKNWCQLKLTLSMPTDAAEYYVRFSQLLGQFDFPREEIVKALVGTLQRYPERVNTNRIQGLAYLKILDAQAVTRFVDASFWERVKQDLSTWINPIYKYTDQLAYLTILSADNAFVTPQGIQLKFGEKREVQHTPLPVLKAA